MLPIVSRGCSYTTGVSTLSLLRHAHVHVGSVRLRVLRRHPVRGIVHRSRERIVTSLVGPLLLSILRGLLHPAHILFIRLLLLLSIGLLLPVVVPRTASSPLATIVGGHAHVHLAHGLLHAHHLRAHGLVLLLSLSRRTVILLVITVTSLTTRPSTASSTTTTPSTRSIVATHSTSTILIVPVTTRHPSLGQFDQQRRVFVVNHVLIHSLQCLNRIVVRIHSHEPDSPALSILVLEHPALDDLSIVLEELVQVLALKVGGDVGDVEIGVGDRLALLPRKRHLELLPVELVPVERLHGAFRRVLVVVLDKPVAAAAQSLEVHHNLAAFQQSVRTEQRGQRALAHRGRQVIDDQIRQIISIVHVLGGGVLAHGVRVQRAGQRGHSGHSRYSRHSGHG